MSKKLKISLFLSICFFAVMFSSFAAFALQSNQDDGKIKVNKTASKTDLVYGRDVDVKLEIFGDKFTQATTIDVVLVLDRSTSMDGSKMRDTKKAAKSLVKKLMSNNTDTDKIVQIGVVTYGTKVLDYSTRPVTSKRLTSDLEEVTQLIDNIPNYYSNQGTNVDAGLEKANLLLSESEASKKIVILLSDGGPTYFNYNNKVYGTGNSDSKVCINGADRCSDSLKKSPSMAAEEEASLMKKDGITIYTIGFAITDNSKAATFLKEVSTPFMQDGKNTYQNFFLAKDSAALELQFDHIATAITTIATDAKVVDVIPLGFTLDTSSLASYGDALTISQNDRGETVITWNIGKIDVTNPLSLEYKLVAKEGYYGSMYTNESAVLTGKSTAGNPAYPSGEIREVFPQPSTVIPAITFDDEYTAKLGETLVISKEQGILSNDKLAYRGDDDKALIEDKIVIRENENSCGKLEVNDDGSFRYTPVSSCYLKKVSFDYEVRTTIKTGKTSQTVISNSSKIIIDVTKDDLSVRQEKLEKINTDGDSTNSLTGPFRYRINYSTVVKDYIGNAIVTLVDQLPYEIDVAASSLDGGDYNRELKTITWVEEVKDIDTYQDGKEKKIRLQKNIQIVFKDVPKDIEVIKNRVNSTIQLGEYESKKTDEQETNVKRGAIIVQYLTKDGVELQDSVVTKGLVGDTENTSAKDVIVKDNVTYQLVKLVENDKEKPLTSSYVATYRDTETVVQYIYYKVVGDVRDDVVSKKGSDVVTSSSQEVEYEINYRAIVDNYIGNASVLLVDSLPYKIDLEKSSLDGGIYDDNAKTITWDIPFHDINTYLSGAKEVKVSKKIKVVFQDLDNTASSFVNQVKGKVITNVSSSLEKEDTHETEICIQGSVQVSYLDTLGNSLADDVQLSGKVGSDYVTVGKNIPGYRLVKTEGDSISGKYVEGILKVKYIYYKQDGSTKETQLSKTGTNLITSTTSPVEYTISYQTMVKEYIGSATVEIIDTLPYEIDLEKSDLGEGIYDGNTKTITWKIDKEINTYEDLESGFIQFSQKIKVVYVGILPEVRSIENKVQATVTTNTVNTVEDTAQTTVNISGKVITHYVDTLGNSLASDDVFVGLVGNPYQSVSKSFPNYKLVEVRGNKNGTITSSLQEVTYVYYLSKGNIIDDKVTKVGDSKITSSYQKVSYEINASGKISDYIGKASLIVVDKLPYEIDLTKSDIQGGVYDAASKTITWEIIFEDINTYLDKSSGIIHFTKKIEVTYQNIDIRAKKLSNVVTSTIKTDTSSSEKESEYTSRVDIKGKVIVNFIDEKGNVLKEQKVLSGSVGDRYFVKQEKIDGYVLVKIDGNEEGKYTEKDIILNYIYSKNVGDSVEVQPPQTGISSKISIVQFLGCAMVFLGLGWKKKQRG